ncbi:MAG: putative MAPEG superfamily protein [Flavobacteriales bacterium]|jgi:uncharacterized MAPEG superfamily protein
MAILSHTLGIFVNPDAEWKAIRDKKSSFQQIFLSHVPLLALIPCISAFYGVTQVGWSVGGGDIVRLSTESAVTLSVISYFALLAGVFFFGEFINWMSKTYGVEGTKEERHYGGTALAVFVSTPLFIAGVFNAYPTLWLSAITMSAAGAYAIYLVYEGIPILMNIDKERAFMYASSVVTVGLVLMVTVMITTVLIWGMGMSPVFVD